MIRGVVNASLEGRVGISVADAQAQVHAVEASIDTGYTGFLILRPATIASLGLTWIAREQGVLADGSIGVFDVYRAAVVWDAWPGRSWGHPETYDS